jgi:DNA-binding response OmpR family regulator
MVKHIYYTQMPNKILVVDDDPSILQIVAEILLDNGYQVNTLAEAEKIFENINLYQPDLILLDVMMGGLDGKIICGALKTFAETKNIPIIMISGDYKNAATLFEHHCPDDFILKPFDMYYLLQRIENQLAA